MKSKYRRHLLCATAVAGLLSAACAGVATAAEAAAAAEVVATQPTPPAPTTPTGPDAAPGVTRSGEASGDGAGEVLVTGSRIRKPNIEANVPISVVDARSIEVSGITDVATLLQRQPQVGIGTNASNTTNTVRNQGISTLSLRNLGTNRTLVLIDGHRQVGGQAGSSAVDVNTISTTLLDRVDTVTGGSSALYGADAVAGVINFILKRDFDGVAAKAQYGGADKGGDTNYFTSITAGKNFDGGRGNVTLSGVFRQVNPIFRSDRDYALTYLAGVPNPLRSTVAGVVNAPANVPLTGVATNTLALNNEAVVITKLGNNQPFSLTFDPTSGQATPFNRGTILLNNRGVAQTSSINCPACFADTLSALQDRVQSEGAESTGRYEFLRDMSIFKSVEAYYEAKYYHTDGYARSSTGTFQSGASNGVATYLTTGTAAGLPSAGSPLPIFLDNAFIPANLKTSLTPAVVAGLPYYQGKTTNPHVFYVNRVDNDFGDRDFKTGYRSFETVAGIRGVLQNDWRFDAFLNYGQTDTIAKNFDRDQVRFFQQLDSVINPATGQAVCRSTLTNPRNGCVPLNPFITNNSAAAKNYSYLYTVERDKNALWNGQFNLTGALFHYKSLLSGTDLPVSFATGFEYRREASENVPDQLNQNGEVFGNVLSINKGSYSTKEGYGEINIPLLADLPLIKRIEVDASTRYQDFTTTGGDFTYEFNATWALSSDFRVRGAYSKAVRAPNINELFAGGSQNYQGIADPCDVSNVILGTQTANRAANCRTLLTALGINPATFVQTAATKSTINLGNPNLQAERATTYTGGFVFTPRIVPHLSLTMDYYDIKIKGAIASLAAGTIVNDCVDSATLNNQFCGQVTRGPDGNVFNVVTSNFNVASLTERGVDLNFSYYLNLRDLRLPDYGRVTFNTSLSYVFDLLSFPVAGDNTTRQQGAGALNFDQPRFRGNANVVYDFGPLTLSYALLYEGPLNLSNQDAVQNFSYERVPEFFQHDLRAEYRLDGVMPRLKNFSVYAGVNNVSNSNPPYIPGVYTGTGTGSLYGPVGRFFYGGVNARF